LNLSNPCTSNASSDQFVAAKIDCHDSHFWAAANCFDHLAKLNWNATRKIQYRLHDPLLYH